METKNQDSFIKLHSSCIPVKGAKRSIVCDLQNNTFFYVPNDLYNFIVEFNGKSIGQIQDSFHKDDLNIIEEYITFLKENEIIFFTQNPELFPSMPMNWDEPTIITNAIIDCNQTTEHNWKTIFDQLESVGCRDIQVRFYDTITKKQLLLMLNELHDRRIKSIEIILKYSSEFTGPQLKKIAEKFVRIKSFFIHSSAKSKVYLLNKRELHEDGMGNILFIEDVLTDNTHCGVISEFYFSPNIKTFTESLNFNSCLNRKVGIDISGLIKNCPSLTESFGSIYTDELSKVVSLQEFQKKWRIRKDEISICKDCEHRYICSDCRAYTVGGDYDKPLKCGYDPYTATWNSESSFKSLLAN